MGEVCLYEEYGKALACYERALFFSTSLETAAKDASDAAAIAKENAEKAIATRDAARKTLARVEADYAIDHREATSKLTLADAAVQSALANKEAAKKARTEIENTNTTAQNEAAAKLAVTETAAKIAISNKRAAEKALEEIETANIGAYSNATAELAVADAAARIAISNKRAAENALRGVKAANTIAHKKAAAKLAVTETAARTAISNKQAAENALEAVKATNIVAQQNATSKLAAAEKQEEAAVVAKKAADEAVASITDAKNGISSRYYNLNDANAPTVTQLCLHITNIYEQSNLLLSIRLGELAQKRSDLLKALSLRRIEKCLMRPALRSAMWSDRPEKSITSSKEMVFAAFDGLLDETERVAGDISVTDGNKPAACARHWVGLNNMCRLYMDEIEHTSKRVDHMNGVLNTKRSLRYAILGIIISVLLAGAGLFITVKQEWFDPKVSPDAIESKIMADIQKTYPAKFNAIPDQIKTLNESVTNLATAINNEKPPIVINKMPPPVTARKTIGLINIDSH